MLRSAHEDDVFQWYVFWPWFTPDTFYVPRGRTKGHEDYCNVTLEVGKSYIVGGYKKPQQLYQERNPQSIIQATTSEHTYPSRGSQVISQAMKRNCWDWTSDMSNTTTIYF